MGRGIISNFINQNLNYMAYDKDKIFQQAIAAIEKHRLLLIEEVVCYLPCVKSTFYDLFPEKSNESNAIKEALEENKVNIKVKIRNKWENSDNPTSQMALYRLVGTDEERKKLSTSYQEISGNIDTTVKTVKVNVVRTREEADKLNAK